MYDASTKFKELMTSNRGVMTSELFFGKQTSDWYINEYAYSDDIVSIDYRGASCSDHIQIGNLVLPSMTIVIKSDSEVIKKFTAYNTDLKDARIAWTLYLEDETMEEPEGAHVCSLTARRVSAIKDGENITIVAESQFVGAIDRVYPQTLTFPADSHDVIFDIAAGLSDLGIGTGIDTTGVPHFQIVSIPQGATFREVLCAIAEYIGCFVTVDRTDSYILFAWYDDALQQIQPLKKDCCDSIELSVADENYNGLICTTASAPVSQGSSPFLTLDNALGFLDNNTSSRLGTLLPKISCIKCRTGRVSLALGNILYDVWDMLKIEPDQRHNLIRCDLQSTEVGGVSFTRNLDGSYTLNGVAAENIDILMESTELPVGEYKMVQDIVDPENAAEGLSWWTYGYEDESSSHEYAKIEYDTPFEIPRDLSEFEHYTLSVLIAENSVFNNVTVYPMIQAADDDYDEYEPYQEDMMIPVCQIDHHYDGGLKTVINIPEINQNDGYIPTDSRAERVETDIAALAAQIASKADSSAVTALAAVVATKADSAAVGAQIASLTLRVENLEEHLGEGYNEVQTDGYTEEVT